MRLATFAAGLLAIGLLGGCVAPSRFEWGGYEGGLYAYAKKPEQRAAYRRTLEEAIKRGRATNRVAPGLLAELGYLHLEDGDVSGAVSLFEEEMRLFPESRKLMTDVITRATAKPAEAASIPAEAKS
jgi:hypothetical protein